MAKTTGKIIATFGVTLSNGDYFISKGDTVTIKLPSGMWVRGKCEDCYYNSDIMCPKTCKDGTNWKPKKGAK
jgi:hypothetical protein